MTTKEKYRGIEMNDLTINGIDHSVFDLEWAKRGGIMLGRDTSDFTCNFARIIHRSINTTNDKERYTIVEFFKMSPKKGCVVFVANNYYTDDIRNSFRMATPQECEDAGVEYIEPPIRWRPIDTTILEELRKDRDLLQFCLDNDTFPVKDQSGAYIMSKDNEFFSVSDSPRKSIELAFEYVKFKADNVMRGEK